MDVMETVVKLCWFAEIEVSGSLDLVKDVIPVGTSGGIQPKVEDQSVLRPT